MMDEVVVVAYGVRKKGTIAGSVSAVKSEKIENVPAMDKPITTSLLAKSKSIHQNRKEDAS